MMIRLFLNICLFFILVNCKESESTEACRSPTFNIFTNDASSISAVPVHQTKNILQGRPGKIGPRGYKGDKGIQGKPGVPDNTVVDALKEKLTAVTKELMMTKKKIDILSPQSIFSCDYIKGAKSKDNGLYLINPDPTRIQPFYVYCDFSGKSPETIINHDLINEMKFTGCEATFCYKRKVQYTATKQQILSLINTSQKCRQFIKLRCVGVYLSNHAAWISRNGNRELYWGGATSERNGYCACGETGTCDNKNEKCNCNKNDPVERSDEGFLTNKNKLPVIEVQFSDNGDRSEIGWHTLGPLICSGRK